MTISQLTEIPYKVYNYREEIVKKENEQKKLRTRKQNATILAAAYVRAQAPFRNQGLREMAEQGRG